MVVVLVLDWHLSDLLQIQEIERVGGKAMTAEDTVSDIYFCLRTAEPASSELTT